MATTSVGSRTRIELSGPRIQTDSMQSHPSGFIIERTSAQNFIPRDS
ncbi:MAG: hypothetical protein WAZ77_20520 [Candidatus Nitrosopolaris sp.]|jgi:hypothetical protein